MEQVYGIQISNYNWGEWETTMIRTPVVFKTESDAQKYITERLHKTGFTRYYPVLMTIYENEI